MLRSKGCDPDVALSAIGSDNRIGNKCLRYGYGFGGPCFPRDNRALGYYANNNGFAFELCHTTDKLNEKHLLFQFDEIKQNVDIS